MKQWFWGETTTFGLQVQKYSVLALNNELKLNSLQHSIHSITDLLLMLVITLFMAIQEGKFCITCKHAAALISHLHYWFG